MIYLENTTEAQVVLIPKSDATTDGTSLEFVAKNTVNLSTEISVEAIDLDISGLYYEIAVTLPDDLPVGEYEYTFSDNGVLLSTGLMQIGHFSKPTQTEIPIEYEQYEN